MAARKKREKRFYVYRIADDQGAVLYVGKGSGNRAKVQSARYGGKAEIVKRFFREVEAFAFERAQIAMDAPLLNKCPGGNGGRVKKRFERREKWEVEMDRVGSRVYVARYLLSLDRTVVNAACPAMQWDALEAVANG